MFSATQLLYSVLVAVKVDTLRNDLLKSNTVADKVTDLIQQKLDKAMEFVQQISDRNHASNGGQSVCQAQPTVEPDRSLNVVMFGISENRDQIQWRTEVDKVLQTGTLLLPMLFGLVEDLYLVKLDQSSSSCSQLGTGD